MLIVGVISLSKTNFMLCIFYDNTLKLYIQKHHKYTNIQFSMILWTALKPKPFEQFWGG